MTRLSGDQIRFGRVWNGFDDDLQVWVVDGIIQPCAHPDTMRDALTRAVLLQRLSSGGTKDPGSA